MGSWWRGVDEIMVDFNLTNYSSNWASSAFNWYQHAFLGFFWDIFFIVLGVYIYRSSNSNTFQMGIYFLGVWAVFGGIFSLITVNAIGIICAFIFGSLFIEKIGEKRQWW